MMEKIKIVYIDDELDISISRYLVNTYKHDEFEKDYEEIKFKSSQGYDTLLTSTIIKEANIIIIDSKLFENDKANTGKFSGEEFKMILKKIFPFIEVIVITQNELEEEYGTFSKYKGSAEESSQEYYGRVLKEAIDKSIKNICIYRNIADKLKINEGIDKVLIEKIMNSLNGATEYEELTKNDIDEIIKTFKEIQKDFYEK